MIPAMAIDRDDCRRLNQADLKSIVSTTAGFSHAALAKN
jgi:hypothetical protein